MTPLVLTYPKKCTQHHLEPRLVGFITERTMLTQLLSLRDQGGPLSGLTEEDVRRLASGAEEVR
ncbi:MAG: hypothetical protein WBI00_10500 [Thermoanaerobaculia bacterium]